MERKTTIYKKLYILWLGLLLAAALMLLNNRPVFKDYSDTQTVYSMRETSQAGTEYGAYAVVNGKVGESCETDAKDFSLEECIKYFGAEIIFSETAGDVINVYLFSPQIKRFRELRGRKVNLHVAYSGGRVVLGSPLIYGGY
ncbi:MAG: hypothetical protein ACLUHK_07230 [Eubacteriales bacterium]